MDYWFKLYLILTALICVYAGWLDVHYRRINHISWIALGLLGLAFGPSQTVSHHVLNASIPLGLFVVTRFIRHPLLGGGDLLFMAGCGPHLGANYLGTFEIVSGICGLCIAALLWSPEKSLKNLQIPLVPAFVLGLHYCMFLQYW